jgi:hypothetical protein
MSGDGQTLVSSCIRGSTVFRIVTMKRMGEAWVHAGDLRTDFFELFQPIGLNTDATVMALSDSGATPAVHVYRWNGGEWIADVEIPAQGGDLEFDASGRLLAIGSDGALEDGAGVSPMPMPGAESRGAVYLFQRNNAGIWTLRNVVKSPNPGVRDGFGGSLSLSGSGRTLVVGTVGEDSNAKGIDGDRTNEGAEDSGAAYLY